MLTIKNYRNCSHFNFCNKHEIFMFFYGWQAGRKKSLNLLLNWHYLSASFFLFSRSTMKQKRRMSPFTCAICSLIHIFYAFLWLHSLRRLPFLIHSSKTYCNLFLHSASHWVRIIRRGKKDTKIVAISHFVVLFYGEIEMEGSTAHITVNINSTLTSKWAYQQREEENI